MMNYSNPNTPLSFHDQDCASSAMWNQNAAVPVNNFLSWQSVNTVPSLPFQFQASVENKPSSFTRKRKSVNFDSADYPKPAKIFVNEERMSAKMCGLYLDNNNVDVHPDLEQQPWYSHQTGVHSSSSLPLPVDSSAASKPLSKQVIPESARLEFCPELQLGVRTREILPQVILDELNKQSMQIVLWQPPASDFVRDVVKASTENCTSLEEDERIQRQTLRHLPVDVSIPIVNGSGTFLETMTDEMDL